MTSHAPDPGRFVGHQSPEAKQYPQSIEYNEFERALVPKPRAIIEGLLEDSSRMIIGGASKTYKSWVMSEQALSIASGSPWWNFQTHRSRVLYINFELKIFHAQRRFRAIREYRELSIEPGWLRIWNLRDEDMPLLAFENQLLKTIEAHQIAVVFIDPFYTLLGENDERVSAELMPILSMFGRINKTSGASIICSAHFTKGNQASKDPIDRISGGASIHRHPDVLMTLTKHKTDHAFIIDFVCRDFAPIEPFVVEWHHPVLEPCNLNPQDIKQPLGRPSVYSAEQILEVLETCDDCLSSCELQKKLHEETGMSAGRFYSLLKELKNQGKIFRSSVSKAWNIQS